MQFVKTEDKFILKLKKSKKTEVEKLKYIYCRIKSLEVEYSDEKVEKLINLIDKMNINYNVCEELAHLKNIDEAKRIMEEKISTNKQENIKKRQCFKDFYNML